jgi:Protein of unknown function (DUF2379)
VTETRHCFDVLRSIAQSPNATPDKKELLAITEAYALLLLPNETVPMIDLTSAREVAKGLCERLNTGSRALGDVIVRSGEAVDLNDFSAAIQDLEEYLSSNPPEYYRLIAANRLSRIRSGQPLGN